MTWTASKYAARHPWLSCPAQCRRSRSIAVRAKNDPKQPHKEDKPKDNAKDNRELSARPVAGNKGPSGKPTVQPSTPDDGKKQRNQPLRSEIANKDSREAGGKSVVNPAAGIRQNSDTRKTSLDAGWGPAEQDRDAVGELVLLHKALAAYTCLVFKEWLSAHWSLPMLLMCRRGPYCSICAWSLCADHNIVQSNR